MIDGYFAWVDDALRTTERAMYRTAAPEAEMVSIRKDELERLKKALQFYAYRSTYIDSPRPRMPDDDPFEPAAIRADQGRRAREALGIADDR